MFMLIILHVCSSHYDDNNMVAQSYKEIKGNYDYNCRGNICYFRLVSVLNFQCESARKVLESAGLN